MKTNTMPPSEEFEQLKPDQEAEYNKGWSECLEGVTFKDGMSELYKKGWTDCFDFYTCDKDIPM